MALMRMLSQGPVGDPLYGPRHVVREVQAQSGQRSPQPYLWVQDGVSAGAAINAAMAMSRRAGVKYRAYKCPFCYLPSGACAWHVGHAVSLKRRLG